jgi:hypothetical protein
MSKNLTRVLVALLLLVTLTTGAAQAAPWSFGDPERSLGSLWSWVVSLFQGSTAEECATDPDGDCPSGENSEEGSSMDPDGLTVGDEGSSMDPNG